MINKLQDLFGVWANFQKSSDVIEYANEKGLLDAVKLKDLLKIMADEIESMRSE